MYSDHIIDTHMHLWDLTNDYPWLKINNPQLEELVGNYDKIKQNFTAKDYAVLAKKHNIVKSVHLQALGFPTDPAGETEWLQEQANQYGFPNGIVGYTDLTNPHLEETLKHHCQHKNMRGIRMILNYHDTSYLRFVERSDYMRDPQWKKGYALLEKYNLVFDAQIYDFQIPDLIAVAKSFPNIPIVLEHFAWPLDSSPEGFEKWRENVASIVECSNVYIKMSNLLCAAFQHTNAIQIIEKYIKTVVQLFGADRCMFGSNYPPDGIIYTFDHIIDIYKLACSHLSQNDQHKIFYDTAERVYRL